MLRSAHQSRSALAGDEGVGRGVGPPTLPTTCGLSQELCQDRAGPAQLQRHGRQPPLAGSGGASLRGPGGLPKSSPFWGPLVR